MAIAIRDPYHRAEALTSFTDPTSWQTIATDHQQNLLPKLLQLGNQPAADATIDAMRDAYNQ